MPATQPDAYWSEDLTALTARLGSGPAGLTSAQAADLLARLGPNSIEETSQASALRLLVSQFECPLILILAFAAFVSLALQQWVDASIILAIVFGSGLLSFFQEYRASTAVAELKRSLAMTTRVLRDGVEKAVPVTTLVPGDVVILSAGNLIPADGRLLEAGDFLVSEAAMTGETFPVEKRPGQVPANAPLTARTNGVFMGASVRSGTALRKGDADIPLDATARAQLEALFKAKGEQGLRVLGLATRVMTPKPDYDRADEAQMTFRGFLTFSDPPKADAAKVIGDLAALGINIKVISGDNRYITAHLAQIVGLDGKAMLTGEQITALDDIGLQKAAAATALFVETDPQQKDRIVRALQKAGHSVGYLGDGINDAPALHAADVGISVKEAVDVARESAFCDQPRSGRAVVRGHRWTAHLCQHPEIYLHHHLGQFRQHGQHGSRHAVSAVPAVDRQTDPAEQLPVGPAVHRHFD